MQFRLSTLLLLFVVLWWSLAVVGLGGIFVFVLVVSLAIGIARSWTVLAAILCWLVLFAILLLLGLFAAFRAHHEATI